MDGARSSLQAPITPLVDAPSTAGAPLTVAAALQRAAQLLTSHGDSPRLDAEILLGSVLGVSRSALIVRGADPVSAETRRAYDQLIAGRMQGAPVAYLTGTREFWSLELDVTPDVLVPRPETEVLVEPEACLAVGSRSGHGQRRHCSGARLGAAARAHDRR